MQSMIYVSSALLATSSATIIGCYFFHRSLAQRIRHEFHAGTLPDSLSALVSLPPQVLNRECHTLYDHASRRVARKLLPAQDPERLFTQLLRRNMTAFSRFPQAWILRSKVPTVERRTFNSSYIQSLQFKEGDLVCGVYRVQERTDNKAVLEILLEGEVNGRLVIRFWEEGAELVFCTETIMWTKTMRSGQRRAVMPLEIPILRFLHEMAAWWLIDSGVTYLMDLNGKESLSEESPVE
ncbi:hypothetical protein BBP40_005143 [Aspergillus hancockii]|nr:hypothetical protein BBP40_005143 [Aspergillus hancockii]